MLQTASSISEKLLNMAWLCEISNICFYIFTRLGTFICINGKKRKNSCFSLLFNPCERERSKERKKKVIWAYLWATNLTRFCTTLRHKEIRRIQRRLPLMSPPFDPTYFFAGKVSFNFCLTICYFYTVFASLSKSTSDFFGTTMPQSIYWSSGQNVTWPSCRKLSLLGKFVFLNQVHSVFVVSSAVFSQVLNTMNHYPVYISRRDR